MESVVDIVGVAFKLDALSPVFDPSFGGCFMCLMHHVSDHWLENNFF